MTGNDCVRQTPRVAETTDEFVSVFDGRFERVERAFDDTTIDSLLNAPAGSVAVDVLGVYFGLSYSASPSADSK